MFLSRRAQACFCRLLAVCSRIKFQHLIELEHQNMNAAIAQGESQWQPV
jgi:hypothetical protein